MNASLSPSFPHQLFAPRTLAAPRQARSFAAKALLCVLKLFFLGSLLGLGGCASQTLFNANFNADTIGSAPSTTQTVGTVSLDVGSGTVKVVAAPSGTSSNWVQINHPSAPSPQTAMRGDFSQFKGDGTYNFLAAVYIPTGTGVVTLQFEPFGQPASSYTNFLHLDFMQNNTVRIDDKSNVVFGSFPRDKYFTVLVTLTITPTGATANMELLGNGASGTLTYPVNPEWLNIAREFGAVRFWMGYQFTGSFEADDILVLYRNP